MAQTYTEISKMFLFIISTLISSVCKELNGNVVKKIGLFLHGNSALWWLSQIIKLHHNSYIRFIFLFHQTYLFFRFRQWFSQTSKFFHHQTPSQLLVLSTFKCSFSLLISKHGSRNRSEIALFFSTVQQPRIVVVGFFFSFQLRHNVWTHFVFEHHFCTEKFHFFVSLPFISSAGLRPGTVTGSAVISSVTEEISLDKLVTDNE